MNKSGQITVFIIIGVIVLAFLGISIFYISTEYEQRIETQQAVTEEQRLVIAPAQSYITTCIKNLAEDGLFLQGFQAGYIWLHEKIPSITTYYSEVPYWFKGRGIAPNEEFVTKELQRYINSFLLDCVNALELPGYKVEIGRVNSRVSLRAEDILVEVFMPVKLERGEFTYEVDTYAVELPIRLQKILGQAYDTVKMLEDVETGVDITFLSDQELPTTLYDFDDFERVFVIRDDKSRVKNKAYQFMFSAQLQKTNRAPVLEFIEPLQGKIGQEVVINVKATDADDDTLTYSIISDVMNIDENSGVITFTPKQRRIYTGIVEVRDPSGEVAFQNVVVEVK